MQNLPEDQTPRDLDATANNVFQDLESVGRGMELRDIFSAFKELNKTQDLVIFSNGSVIATRKGLRNYG
jgi:hypothetical protein